MCLPWVTKSGYNRIVSETRTQPAATVTINLTAAGLTHTKGKSDYCGGEHDVPVSAVVYIDDPDWLPADDVTPVLQALHEQAHPDGAAYWQNCRERGCADVEW